MAAICWVFTSMLVRVTEAFAGKPCGFEPDGPPDVIAVNENVIENLFGRFGAAFAGDIMRAANRRESLAQQEMAGEARPIALAGTDHHINAFIFQVHLLVGNIKAHGKFGMKQLKAAKARRQPDCRQWFAWLRSPARNCFLRAPAGSFGRDRQGRGCTVGAIVSPFSVKATPRAWRTNRGCADEAFQKLDLVAHGRLGHVQFGGGAAEIAVAGHGFKNPDGGKGRHCGHD